MENRRTHLLTSIPLLVLFACAEPSDSVDGTWQQVAGGQRDRGSPQVVLLFNWESSNPVGTLHTCTAELVAPNVLLTAAHCLASNSEFYAAYLGADGNDLGAPIDPGKASVRKQLHFAKETHAHPQYVTTNGYYDVGVVILEEELTEIEPLPILRVKPTAAMLSNVSIVGYGKTHDRDTSFAVTKYRADGLTGSLDPTHSITVGDDVRHACVGDSGGPLLAQVDGVWTILGTDSYSDETGDASRCRMPSHYQRVDPYLDFLDEYIPRPVARDAGTPRDAAVDASADAAVQDAGRAADASVDASPEPARRDAGAVMRSDAGREEEEEEDEEPEDAPQAQTQPSDGCNLTRSPRSLCALLVALLVGFAVRRRGRAEIADR